MGCILGFFLNSLLAFSQGCPYLTGSVIYNVFYQINSCPKDLTDKKKVFSPKFFGCYKRSPWVEFPLKHAGIFSPSLPALSLSSVPPVPQVSVLSVVRIWAVLPMPLPALTLPTASHAKLRLDPAFQWMHFLGGTFQANSVFPSEFI